jgi:hypothetical protein
MLSYDPIVPSQLGPDDANGSVQLADRFLGGRKDRQLPIDLGAVT